MNGKQVSHAINLQLSKVIDSSLRALRVWRNLVVTLAHIHRYGYQQQKNIHFNERNGSTSLPFDSLYA